MTILPDNTGSTVIVFDDTGVRELPVVAWAIDADEHDSLESADCLPLVPGYALPEVYCLQSRDGAYWFHELTYKITSREDAITIGKQLYAELCESRAEQERLDFDERRQGKP